MGGVRPGVPRADGSLPQEAEEPSEGEADRRQLRLDGAPLEADQGKFGFALIGVCDCIPLSSKIRLN